MKQIFVHPRDVSRFLGKFEKRRGKAWKHRKTLWMNTMEHTQWVRGKEDGDKNTWKRERDNERKRSRYKKEILLVDLWQTTVGGCAYVAIVSTAEKKKRRGNPKKDATWARENTFKRSLDFGSTKNDPLAARSAAMKTKVWSGKVRYEGLLHPT